MTARRRDGIAALGGAFLFLGCALVARSGTVGSVEQQVFEAINGLTPALEGPATAMQFAGTLAIGPIVAVAALVFGRVRLAFAVALVTGAKLLAERAVWEVLIRERPGTTQPNAILRGEVPEAGPSFVSGHVVLTTALAWVVTPSLPRRWRPVPWVIVGLVAFARVYLGAHNPLDVVGGFGLGLAIGGSVHALVRPEREAKDVHPVAAAPPAAEG